MESRITTVIAAFALLGATLVTTAGAQELPDPEDPPIPSEIDVSLGDAYFEDFQDDDGDWTSFKPNAEAEGWEWGHPTSGPDLSDEDRNMWGTNLDGDYGPTECSWIESPTIDLTTETATVATHATLSWEQWYRSSSLSAGGVVQIGVDGDYTTIEPEDGYPDSSDDDLVDCLDNEDVGQYDGFEDSSFDEPGPHQADVSDFLGEEITVRYLFASEDTSFTYDGWFVDDVAVELSIHQDLPDVEAGIPAAEHPGWTSDGDWGWGAAAEAGPTGTLAYGTNLNGDYTDDLCSVLETSVDVPVEGGELSWDQWVRSSSFRAGGVVQVVDDEGPHNIVPEEGYLTGFAYDFHDDCLLHETQGTDTMGGFEQSSGDPMDTFHADLSDWSGEQVTLRFVWSAQNGFGTYDGWYVNNVTLDGLPLIANSPDALGPILEEEPPEPEEIVEEVDSTVNAVVGQAEAQQNQYPGWTVGGEHISWAHDEATTGPEGEEVTATNPHGVHSEEEYECSYVQSPTLPTAAIGGDLELTFDHYRDMSHQDGTWSSGARTASSVLVSTDAGANWTLLDTDANDKDVYYTTIFDCFEELGVDEGRDLIEDVGVISGESGAMETLTVDLSDYEDAPTLTVRLVFGTGTTIFAQGGWYVNNVSIGDVQLMP